jgi:uncharacterized protein
MPYHHGIKIVEVTEGARPLSTVSTSVIGLVATADDADALAFPLDTLVEVSDIDGAIGKAGLTGTLASALRAILDQTRTIVLVVRVAASAVAATQTANVVGTTNAQGQRTGIQALLSAQSKFGYKPRILGAPGLDSQGVAAALAVAAAKLGGMAYCLALGATNAATIGYRANFFARELMLITPDVKALNDAGATVASSAVARALGLRAKIDQQIGWHKTISNVGIEGVLGVTRDIEFDIMDMNNDAGLLNAADITTIVRRDGYRFWGSRTCSDEPLFTFESAVRTAQVLRDTIAEGLFWAIDKPLTPGLVKDILSTINHAFSQLKAQGYILGANAWFDPAKNLPTQLASGILDLDYDYTPVPPLEALHLTQRITDHYFVDFSKLIAG